ncbi:MAG: hypothetical protein ACOC1P_02820 [Minisyncoccales bacterium]
MDSEKLRKIKEIEEVIYKNTWLLSDFERQKIEDKYFYEVVNKKAILYFNLFSGDELNKYILSLNKLGEVKK